MSSMEVNVDMLEQMDLMDMSDHEALDVFLHSGGEDNSVASPVTGIVNGYTWLLLIREINMIKKSNMKIDEQNA